jgi:hypothetical protein
MAFCRGRIETGGRFWLQAGTPSVIEPTVGRPATLRGLLACDPDRMVMAVAALLTTNSGEIAEQGRVSECAVSIAL